MRGLCKLGPEWVASGRGAERLGAAQGAAREVNEALLRARQPGSAANVKFPITFMGGF